MSRTPTGKRPGAPAGNRNRLTTGCHTAEARAFRAEVRAHLRETRALIAWARALSRRRAALIRLGEWDHSPKSCAQGDPCYGAPRQNSAWRTTPRRHQSEELHEHPRISGQRGPAGLRRARAPGQSRLHRRRSRGGRESAAGPGLGCEGADPCRRTRQGRRRQGRQVDRGCEERSRAHAGHDAGHPPDRPGRPPGQAPLYRRRLGHRARALSLGPRRPRNLPRLLHRLDRRRHGHRGSRGQDAREDPHLPDRTGRRAIPAMSGATSPAP